MGIGYGADTFCSDKYRPGKIVRGPTVVVQALFRRLITKRGTLRGGDEERAYGLDVAGFIGHVGPRAGAALPTAIRAELLKDDRVSTVIVQVASVTETSGLQSFTIAVSGALHDEEGDFEFTVQASAISIELLGGVS